MDPPLKKKVIKNKINSPANKKVGIKGSFATQLATCSLINPFLTKNSANFPNGSRIKKPTAVKKPNRPKYLTKAVYSVFRYKLGIKIKNEYTAKKKRP